MYLWASLSVFIYIYIWNCDCTMYHTLYGTWCTYMNSLTVYIVYSLLQRPQSMPVFQHMPFSSSQIFSQPWNVLLFGREQHFFNIMTYFNGKVMTNSWQSYDKVMAKSRQSHCKVMEKSWQSHDKVMTKSWQSHDKVMTKSWQSHGKVTAKSGQSHYKERAKSWQSHGKVRAKSW